MKISIRTDLGGYATALPGVAGLQGLEITKPFVLFVGPNGAGKTALLRMMRATMGLEGECSGEARRDGAPSAAVAECGGDPALLAALVAARNGAVALDPGHPGMLDVAELGWQGQRSWLYSSRQETAMLAAASIDLDLGIPVSTFDHGPKASHGQILRGAWGQALRWAHGAIQSADPFDAPHALPPARRALWDMVRGEGSDQPRPAERWLFLDEPEVALDMHSLLWGLSALVQNCALGRLRVFCASHSPLFAAGLADHPNVQVVDFGSQVAGDGNGWEPGDWFPVQRNALKLVRDMDAIDGFALEVSMRCRVEAKHNKRRAEAQERDRVAKAMRGLSPVMKSMLLRVEANPGLDASHHPDGKPIPDRTITAMQLRGLIRISRAGGNQAFFPTPLGQTVASLLAEKASA